MREKTASHDLHFGHFKAATTHDHNLYLHYIMAEIPFRTGFVPDRWKVATNVMILKKAGLFNIEKLRTLCLFQADHNHNNKFLGRNLMAHAVKNNAMAKEQFSVIGKRSISHALNKTLLFDAIRYQKYCAGHTSCDLKSCFDRIVHTPAMLAARSCGIPKPPLVSFFATLQEVQYHTRTCYGVSEETFGGMESNFSHAPQGAGQGNGAAPQLWALVSSKMFSILHELGLATIVSLPISGTDLHIVGFAYVDDSDLFTFSTSHDINETVNKMQIIVDAWERSAKLTGGAIAPLKCWWYLIMFEWNDNGDWKYGSLNDTNQIKLTACDENAERQEIKYLRPYEAQEMLGVYIAPDGNCDVQYGHLLDRARQLADKMRTTPCYQHEAWLGLTSIAMKSIEYCVPATTLSKEQCDTIMWQLIKEFLPKAGINRYIKRDIMYACPEITGLGLKSLYLTQGISHVAELIEQQWKNSITGHFQMMNLECLRLELGLNIEIFDEDYATYKELVLTNSWMVHTWEFMSSNNITLNIGPPKIQHVRERDIPIMDAILHNRELTTFEKRTANKCRIFLQAFMLSDITTGNGTKITVSAWRGTRSQNRNSAIKWPLWKQPTALMWTTWRSVIHRTFCTRKEGQLDEPLGKWLTLPSYWRWFTNGHVLVYTEQNGKGITIHHKSGGTQRRPMFHVEGNIDNDSCITGLRPTTIVYKDNYILHEGIGSYADAKEIPTPCLAYKTWLQYELNQSDDNNLLLKQQILLGEAIGVSDGSFFESTLIGTAAWVFTDNAHNTLAEGTSIVPGNKKVFSSLRCELVGILAMLEFLTELCDNMKIKAGGITLHCDNLTAVSINNDWSVLRMTPSHTNADIISACLKVRDKLPLHVHFKHVYAHQDKDKSFYLLDPIAKLNVQVDLRAKQLATSISMSTQQQFKEINHPSAFPTSYWNNNPIHHEIKNSLYKEITTDNVLSYWIEKRRVTPETLTQIDLTAMGEGISPLSLTMKRFITKWSCESIGTGKNMQRWKLRHCGDCPFCTEPDENTLHIFQCPSIESLDAFKEAFRDLVKKLLSLNTCIQLLVAIRNDVMAWRKGYPTPATGHLPLGLQRAIFAQRDIGWKQFFEGLVAKHWGAYMSQYYLHKKTKNTGRTWSKRLIKYNWEFTHEIWTSRNTQLHETERVKELEGVSILRQTVMKEWEQGLGRLPAADFSHYFSMKSEELMNFSTDYLKSWLLIVRQGRILMDGRHLLNDEFATSRTLQQWIGITYDITDEEGHQILKRSASMEWEKGLNTLDASTYGKHFEHTLQEILNFPLASLKMWFVDIRNGRLASSTEDVLSDEFSHDGLLKVWVGL